MNWNDGKDAASFAGLEPPNEAVEIGRVTRRKNTFIFYRDKEGKLYYDTLRGLRFKKKMEEAQRMKATRKEVYDV